MHRMHHEYSDTENDPHSPSNTSIRGVFLAQHKAYERVLIGLHRGKEKYTQHVPDLDFGVHWLNTNRLWWLPFAIHFTIGALVGTFAGMPLLDACYFFGLMCHPVQGWMVNSFGHAVGPRNFDTSDNSHNNTWVAWLVVGEGLQNNHHAYPASAKLAYAPGEPDLGYRMCLAFETLGLLTINQRTMIPAYSAPAVKQKKPNALLPHWPDSLNPQLR